MNTMEATSLISLVGGLMSVLILLIGYIGSNMVKQLKNIAWSVNKIEVDLSVLSNDHHNLKNEVKEIKQQVQQGFK